MHNDYRLDIRNGDRATVEAIDTERRTMRIRVDDRVRTLPASYLADGHVTHAYATTIHKAQGITVDRSLVLGTDDLYRQAGYVALSRGRHTNTLYAIGTPTIDPDLTHAPKTGSRQPADLVWEALGKRRAKLLASETVATHDRDDRSLERQKRPRAQQAPERRSRRRQQPGLDIGL